MMIMIQFATVETNSLFTLETNQVISTGVGVSGGLHAVGSGIWGVGEYFSRRSYTGDQESMGGNSGA